MLVKLVGIKNPHKPDLDYSVKEESIQDGIWRIYVNPERIDFMRAVVSKDNNISSEIGIGGHVFRVDCTLDALAELIRDGEDVLVI